MKQIYPYDNNILFTISLITHVPACLCLQSHLDTCICACAYSMVVTSVKHKPLYYHIQCSKTFTFYSLCREGSRSPHSRSFFTRIANVFAVPKIVFFPIPHCARILANPDFQVAVKLCIPLTFPESRSVFWPNPGSREYPFRPCFRLLTLDTV